MRYLECYGAGVDRRIGLMKRSAISLAALAVASLILFFVLHNFRQEQQARRFFERLGARDYHGAYALWVRTASDREAYPMEAFLEDWGPGTRSQYRIVKSRSCGSGVILTIDDRGPRRERLWVQRDSLLIGFAPPPDLLPKVCSF